MLKKSAVCFNAAVLSTKLSILLDLKRKTIWTFLVIKQCALTSKPAVLSFLQKSQAGGSLAVARAQLLKTGGQPVDRQTLHGGKAVIIIHIGGTHPPPKCPPNILIYSATVRQATTHAVRNDHNKCILPPPILTPWLDSTALYGGMICMACRYFLGKACAHPI